MRASPASQSVDAVLLGAVLPGEADSPSTVRAAAPAGRRILAGLIGRGIQASRTPGMHQAEGKRLGLRYTYRLLDFDALGLDDGALPEAIDWAARHGFAGLNVTHPFKESVTACLDALTPEAASIGAVNTVVLRDGRSTGYNTDCWGFAESFRRSMVGVKLAEIVLLGAGGAGAAVGRALCELGAGRLSIFDVDQRKAAGLADGLAAAVGEGRARAAESLEAAVAEADGLVNASPVGMAKYPGMPVPPAWLRSDLWVTDIVYFPQETQLLAAARGRGCRVLGGTGMAVFQAVLAFELITGVAPDAGEMARHFDKC